MKKKISFTNIKGMLSRDQMRQIKGGCGDRCSNDRLCSMYSTFDGGCAAMQTGQCRCVKYVNGTASESVPDSACLA